MHGHECAPTGLECGHTVVGTSSSAEVPPEHIGRIVRRCDRTRRQDGLDGGEFVVAPLEHEEERRRRGAGDAHVTVHEHPFAVGGLPCHRRHPCRIPR